MLSTRLPLAALLLLAATAGAAAAEQPVRLIFDTDMGNDVDDALALGVIHALADRGECELLAVTLTKDHPLCAPYVDLVNTFYGRGDTPIGVTHSGVTPQESRFLPLAQATDNGALRYPHDLTSGDQAAEAIGLLRRVLAEQPDRSVVIVQVGFSTNLAALLDSPPDGRCPLNGRDLAQAKVKFVSAMAGAYGPVDGRPKREYNVEKDASSARAVAAGWPTPIVFSGFEVGQAVRYPAASIENDFRYASHHPLAEAYQLYQPTPHERPCWDLTSVLYAIRPCRGYFGLSPAGRVAVQQDATTRFTPSADGPHRFLTVDRDQVLRTTEALAQLASQPPRLGPGLQAAP
ncbi:ribonucleoside hydrolase 1 [Pirellulimonas nuda]|uniref:Ribonucleoside hydrolase 1 n=1 Tax=Pirellulimonas nuda TaxID=2528009 RepID=A0A518DCQ0_9BACT|nr:nucleoside hydrolase [Pirellulimonas nuda]QDU89257.1 ribonucleoside hydrolase 1 [Pirellulimonas nuda]